MMNNVAVSETQIILETKNKIERSKVLFPNNIPKLKKNFINVSGMSVNEWEIIFNFPPIRDQNDFNRLLNELKKEEDKHNKH